MQVGTNFESLVGQLQYVDDDDDDDTRLATIVGVCVGVPVLIFVIACLIFDRRRNRKQKRQRENYEAFGSQKKPDVTLEKKSGKAHKKTARYSAPPVAKKNTDTENILQSAALPTMRQEKEGDYDKTVSSNSDDSSGSRRRNYENQNTLTKHARDVDDDGGNASTTQRSYENQDAIVNEMRSDVSDQYLTMPRDADDTAQPSQTACDVVTSHSSIPQDELEHFATGL